MSLVLTEEKLRKIATAATSRNITTYYPLLRDFMTRYAITGTLCEAAFLAQIIHESGSFAYTRELASGEAYEGRADLGNNQPGDGLRFKGRGLIQITGRNNYKQISTALGTDFVASPALLEKPDYATLSACWWWSSRGLNRLATAGEFKKITKVINGGYNGFADREKWYKKALEILK